jgi:hypothetical protein
MAWLCPVLNFLAAQQIPGPCSGSDPHRATSTRLARSAGDSPAEARARSLVAWMAGRRETDDLKPIDKAIFGMAASHQAVTKVNTQVAPKSGSGGRALGG